MLDVLAPILLSLVCVGLLLLAEWRGSRAGVWISKPLASAGFVWLGCVAAATPGAPDAYTTGVLGALLLSFAGDVLLIPKDRPRVFLAGLVSFLLAHVAYGAAFLASGVTMAAALATALLLAPVLYVVVRWLGPHLPRPMRLPVRAYLVVISGMLIGATGAAHAAHDPRMLIGALLFYLSDLAVARDRFVAPGPINRTWGLPFYYVGQLVLASSIAG